MKSTLKIGLVIADPDEYSPILKYVKSYKGEPHNFYTLKGHCIKIPKDDGEIAVYSVLCGTGKVNATTAAAWLVDFGVDIVINAGLSGGVSGVSRGDIVASTTLIEHDFDLRCLGYKFAEKPGQEYIYKASEKLNSHFKSLYPAMKSGPLACGDSFVNDPATRDILKNEFGAVACDMESAAVASVCHIASVPFTAIRRISDDAGEGATDSYRQMNSLAESCLTDIVFVGISSLSLSDF